MVDMIFTVILVIGIICQLLRIHSLMVKARKLKAEAEDLVKHLETLNRSR